MSTLIITPEIQLACDWLQDLARARDVELGPLRLDYDWLRSQYLKLLSTPWVAQ